MSDTPVMAKGWSMRQIADFVGGGTSVSIVWNWRQWSRTREYTDHRRFPDSVGRHPVTNVELFDPIEVQKWLKLNDKEISLDAREASEIFRYAEELRGQFDLREVMSILMAAVSDNGGELRAEALTAATRLRKQLGNLNNDKKRELLRIIRSLFTTTDFLAEFTTSETLASFVARLLEIQPNATVFDPCAGTATLLAACANESEQPESIRLVGREIKADTAKLGRALLSLTASAKQSALDVSDSFFFDRSLVGFADVAVADVPMGMRVKVAKPHIALDDQSWRDGVISSGQVSPDDPRFVYAAPNSSGDVAWIQITLAALRPAGGRAAVVVTPSVGFSTPTRELRDALVRRRHLESVIELPSQNTRGRSRVRPIVLLLDTVPQRALSRDHILFISIADEQRDSKDVSQWPWTLDQALEIVKRTRRLNFAEADNAGSIDTTTGSVRWRLAPIADVVKNDFSLRPNVYLVEEKNEDLPALTKEIEQTAMRLAAAADRFRQMAISFGGFKSEGIKKESTK